MSSSTGDPEASDEESIVESVDIWSPFGEKNEWSETEMSEESTLEHQLQWSLFCLLFACIIPVSK